LIEILNKLGFKEELDKVKLTKKLRPGVGKSRNRRYLVKKGPLIVYDDENIVVKHAAANIPGVDVCHISRLNLLQLAPGGHVGRLVIWTKNAFSKLTALFGTIDAPSTEKNGYTLNRPLLQNANISRIINSDEIQSIVRPARKNCRLHEHHKRNPLKNKAMMHKLNPFDKIRKASATKKAAESGSVRENRLKQRRVVRKSKRPHGKQFIRSFRQGLETANQATIERYKKYISDTKVGLVKKD